MWLLACGIHLLLPEMRIPERKNLEEVKMPSSKEIAEDAWAEAMSELNSALEVAKEAGVSKEEAIQEVMNIYES